MSEKLFYIRKRGQVSGPFSVAQLQALYQRGQFGRFHEVSEDRQAWTAASSLAFLFPSAPASDAAMEVASAPLSAQATQMATWYYLDAAGQPQGPVSRGQLDHLRQSGQISGQSLVFQTGMATWTALDQVAATSVAVAVPLEAVPAAASWDEDACWRRVRGGVTLLIVSMFVWVGALLFQALALALVLVEEASPAVLGVLVLYWVLLLAARVVEAVGDGFLAAAPRTLSGRWLAVAAFVLALIWPLSYLLMVLASLLSHGRAADPIWGVLALAGVLLASVLDAFRLLLVQRFLQVVATRWQAADLARVLTILLILYAIFWGLVLLAAAVGAGVGLRGPLESGALVVLLALFWVIALSAGVLALFWFVRFLIVLFQVRTLISQAALRE
jgi:hypothetical protein